MIDVVVELPRSRLAIWRERAGWAVVAFLVVGFWVFVAWKVGEIALRLLAKS